MNKLKIFKIAILICTLIFVSGCKSKPQTVIAGERSVSGYELKNVANQFSKKIINYFYRKNLQDKVLVALLNTKNDTTERLPVDVLDFSLVNNLLASNIYTVRTEDRSRAIEEIEFNLSGLSDSNLKIGTMKSPNFFIKMKIKENHLRQGDNRIVEFTIIMELRSVETQLVVASDLIQFTKESGISSNKLGW